MFKLLRLAIYALVGYAAYQFVMDLVHATQEQQKPQRAQGQGRGNRGGSGGGNRGRGPGGRTRGGAKAVAGAVMTAASRAGGQGKQEETQNPDGGSVRHRVGRGVV
jgi:hypothetical protein